MEEPNEQLFTDEPDINFLQGDLERCRNNLSYYKDKSDTARDSRFGAWAGRNYRTNRKEGPTAFPWPGASDQAVGLIDQIVGADVAMMKRAVSGGNLRAVPTEATDSRVSALVGKFMKWTLSEMTEFNREVGILANNVQMYGNGILGTYWCRKIDRYYDVISLEEIAQQAPELAEAIMAKDKSANQLLSEAFPSLKKSRINKMIKGLQKQGQAEVPKERLVENRPSIKSYEIGRDIIFDSNVLSDIQNARAIYCVHHHSPESLKEMIFTQGFDPEYVEELIKKGASQNASGDFTDFPVHRNHDDIEHYEGLIRLVSCYRRELDEDGVPLISHTIFSEDIDGYAKHELSAYSQGKYPFTSFCRETINHRILDSRGLCEILHPYEQAIKVEIDSRIDRASLSTIPPLTHLVGRKPERIGPGSFVPVRRPGEIQFMDIPAYSPASTEVENELRMIANKIAGRPTSNEDQVEANLIRQEMVSMWLANWRPVLKQLWHLQRTYGGPEQWVRATGNEQDLQATFEETSEQFDFELTFNADSLDQDKSLDKLKALGEVFSQYDRQGQANFGELMKLFAESIDPNLADRLIMPQQASTQKEVEETSSDLAKIASGQVVNAPENANPQLRMQVVQGYLQGTEEIPGEDIQNRLQQDEGFKARLENYMKQISFQEQQQRNALTGKLGAPPGNVPASSAQPQQVSG